MKSRIYIYILFVCLGLCISKVASAQASSSDADRKQVPDKDKPWVPSSSPEKKAEKKKGKKKQQDPNRQLTKKELGKKLKQDEIEQKKNYEMYHDKVQTKKVRKRMKENAKSSTDYNNGKLSLIHI